MDEAIRKALKVAGKAARQKMAHDPNSCVLMAACGMAPCACANATASAAIAAFLEAIPVEMLDTVPDVGYMDAVACRNAWLAAVRRAAGGG